MSWDSIEPLEAPGDDQKHQMGVPVLTGSVGIMEKEFWSAEIQELGFAPTSMTINSNC